MNPVVHFEMPAKNKKRTAKFYSSVFGWQMMLMGDDMGKYLLATTSPTDKKGMHKKKGAINGGFFQHGKEGTVPHLVLSVDNLTEHMKKVKRAGGRTLGKPQDIPGIGTFIMFKDTEGNKVGMLQPSRP